MKSKQKEKPVKVFQVYPPKFKELTLEVIEADANQPRKGLGLRGDQNRLMKSIQYYGIEDPIKVCELEPGRFKIMDGHRRFSCAKQLNLEKVPCRIYPKMSMGEFEARRYEMQNNRRSWKPLEKANALHKIRTELSANKKELAELIGVSSATVVHFTKLRDTRMEYLELMAEYGMKESHRIEFMRVLPKLRKIKNFEIDDIVKVMFEKIKMGIIRNSRDFRTLSKIFLRATLHEEEIFKFLTELKMTVSDLDKNTMQSGFSSQIENLIKDLSAKKNQGIELTKKEQQHLEDLYSLIKAFV